MTITDNTKSLGDQTQQHVCPNCGYCPTCGRKHQAQPQWPNPWPNYPAPYIGDPPAWFTSTTNGLVEIKCAEKSNGSVG